jgi:hypothetical protein
MGICELKIFFMLKEPYNVLLSLVAMLAYVKDFIDGNSSIIDMPYETAMTLHVDIDNYLKKCLCLTRLQSEVSVIHRFER